MKSRGLRQGARRLERFAVFTSRIWMRTIRDRDPPSALTRVAGMAQARVRAMYVEIPVEDLDRAEHFYREFFGASTRRTVIDGHPCCILDDDGGDGEGAVVALMQGESYVPSLDGTRVYIAVADVGEALARARELGGSVLYPATEVADGLVIAELTDSEGNRLAISSR